MNQSIVLDLLVLLFAGVLVFFMQLGFAFVESGMSRSKNTVNVLMKNFCDLCVGGLVFWCVGYGLMYGASATGWYGADKFFPSYVSNRELGLIFFQIMFASAAATIVSGAIAERTHFSAYLISSAIICAVIYPVVGGWVWNSNGWLAQMGFIDFAGSTVVHSIGGWCALAALLVVKPRLGRFAPDGTPRLIEGHSLSNTLMGGLILWVGWFGFNVGSLVTPASSSAASNWERIGLIVLNTHMAGCSAVAAALLLQTLMGKRIMLSVTVNAAIGGLVSVTAASATIYTHSAIAIGAIAGVLVVWAQPMLERFKLDDVVGAVSVHLVCGVWGTVAVAIFSAKTGFSSNQLIVQLIGVGAVGLATFMAATIMYVILDKIIGMRVSPLAEQRGLDISEHAEVGYPEFQKQLHQGAAHAQQSRA